MGKAKAVNVGLSVRNGPVREKALEVDNPTTSGKRKSRSSLPKASYKEESDESDSAPLVCSVPPGLAITFPLYIN